MEKNNRIVAMLSACKNILAGGERKEHSKTDALLTTAEQHQEIMAKNARKDHEGLLVKRSVISDKHCHNCTVINFQQHTATRFGIAGNACHKLDFWCHGGAAIPHEDNNWTEDHDTDDPMCKKKALEKILFHPILKEESCFKWTQCHGQGSSTEFGKRYKKHLSVAGSGEAPWPPHECNCKAHSEEHQKDIKALVAGCWLLSGA